MTIPTETLSVNGESLIADLDGGLVVPAHATLIVSDLHFEKGSAYAERGQFLPPYDTRATLDRLEAMIARHAPQRVVALGDSFHDLRAENRMARADFDRLAALVTRLDDWVWIEGNHDPKPPEALGGQFTYELQLGRLTLRHEPLAGHAPGEIAGHLHPCAKVAGNGRSVRARCFALGQDRLIMPAFGAYTGGLNILDAAFADCMGERPDALVMGRSNLHFVRGARCRPDRPRLNALG